MLPAPHPPSPHVLRAAGVRVQWPVRASARREPGDRLVVRVRARRRHGHRVRIALARVDEHGRRLATLRRTTVRRGHARRVRLRLPRRAPGIYALRLRVARHRYWSWILTTPPAPPTPPPAVAPNCVTGEDPEPASVALRFGAASGHAGDRIPYEIVNKSDTYCVIDGVDYDWQRQNPDGTWSSVPAAGEHVFPAVAFIIPPGDTWSGVATVWPELTPGAYRFHKVLRRARQDIELVAPFQVLAP